MTASFRTLRFVGSHSFAKRKAKGWGTEGRDDWRIAKPRVLRLLTPATKACRRGPRLRCAPFRMTESKGHEAAREHAVGDLRLCIGLWLQENQQHKTDHREHAERRFLAVPCMRLPHEEPLCAN